MSEDLTDNQIQWLIDNNRDAMYDSALRELQRRRSHPTIPKGDLELAREWLLIKYAVYPDIPHDVAAFAALLTATRADEREKCWRAVNSIIVQGHLPGNGCDPMAQRNGLVLAANAILDQQSPGESLK